jgi:crotonobetainyl-CoA:carnitine CoA-transferase CaiB-like acyl-CoA transferase
VSDRRPRVGDADRRASGPLVGIRILDLSIALTGPYAVALLGDQGAEVVKVERPGLGDIGRWIGVSVNGMSALYQACNRGKRSIAVDAGTPAGRDIVRLLTAQADVIVENFRPGVMDRLGLGYQELRQDHEDLIYVSLTGFGPDGPYAGKSAYDTVIQAYAGIAANQADPVSGEPRFLNQTVADKVTALVAAQAITAALFARERGAGGQHVQLSMLDAVVSFLWADAAGNEVLLAADGSRPSSFVANFKPFRFRDGWGIATPTSDADFAGMCRSLGVEGYDDPRVATIAERNQHRDLTRQIMDRVYAAAATMTTAEAMGRMERERVPCGVVLTPAELSEDPHARAIGLLVDDVHPVAGPIRQPRHPIRFPGTPATVGGPAPMLGQHTDEILAELGLGDRIAALRAEHVVS